MARSVFVSFLLEQCDRLKDPVHRAACEAWVVQDQHVNMLSYLGHTLTYQGYVEQGRRRLNAALTEARELRHALTLANALFWMSLFEHMIGSHHDAQRYTKELAALSNEEGFPFFVGWAIVLQGWSLATLGNPQEGLDLSTKGLSMIRAMGSSVATAFILTVLAEAHGTLGRPLEGLGCLGEASQIIETNEVRWDPLEVLRLRGELLVATGDRTMAEASYHQSLAVATQQGTKMFELRAATSLARLWRDQGKRSEARELLAPVYGWFTEGFDTLDLREAKALLDELAS